MYPSYLPCPYCSKGTLIAGCDEVGRGCIAGPLMAAAIILPPIYNNFLIKDSKKLTPSSRIKLANQLKKDALDWAVGFVTPQEVDRHDVLNASHLAMHRAIDKLSLRPKHLLIDGNRFEAYPGISHTCLVRGDARCSSIAAASVIAKVSRDEYMRELGELAPGYSWEVNKGYPTKSHREAILHLGASPHHRKTFMRLGLPSLWECA